MKVSIIVPCYKVEKFLPTCIDSVRNQSYSDWELILVNDGSPDRSGEICDKYANIDERIKVIHKKNAGVAAARNTAINIATGKYAAFLDGDDFLHPDFLYDMVNIIEKYNADIAQCDFVKGNKFTFPKYMGTPKIKEYDSHQIFATETAKIVVWGKLYRIDILKNLLIPEGRFFEDDLITWRWYYVAKKIIVTTKPYYYYTYNEEGTMAQHHKKPNLSFIEGYDERINFFQKTKEIDLEHYSHLQLCKALFLTMGNSLLSSDQRSLVLYTFRKSWKIIHDSPYIAVKYKILFVAFNLFPQMISKLQMLNKK